MTIPKICIHHPVFVDEINKYRDMKLECSNTDKYRILLNAKKNCADKAPWIQISFMLQFPFP